MSQNHLRILDHDEIFARLKRMAYEIYENNYQQSEMLVIGIDQRGGFIAEKLVSFLSELSPIKVTLIDAEVDQSESLPGVSLSAELEDLTGKAILVVDDVLYSGFTMLSVVSILLQLEPSTIQTAVLIDRGHRKMPISADYVGLELSTTLHQHVSVRIDEDEEKAEVFLV
ncbi:MAG: phosphoribosyltransferase [Bacteroidetes bacterium]|nr:phosphoribosyltransferase [Bacteroidota bacterium]MCB0841816.1 phosphoribosyltransferase [Bacteroidota bacterium]